ncbi:hypothetical protein B0J11DRAFT_584286 [Dendryphion nanum]|uniref:Uncharacterized protein n=1 Tax=Dendryphion nanum TaxID=256645 RepID=A0A9P9IE86_9PLEO|nr:hypothetical protein B0J11DRAFT_584286 [Dendryphion nanum]
MSSPPSCKEPTGSKYSCIQTHGMHIEQLPDEYKHLLPSTVTHDCHGQIENCFCHICVPALYQQLAAPKVIQAHPPLVLNHIRNVLSLPILGSRRLNRLALVSKLTKFEALIQYNVGKPKRLMKKHNTFPIATLADLTNEVFFDSAIEIAACEWSAVAHGINLTGAYLFDQNKIELHCALVDSPLKPAETVRMRTMDLLGNLLHEQVHAYLTHRLCWGQCEGTAAQLQLCKFFWGRMMFLFEQVKFADKEATVPSISGHGPLFQRVVTLVVEHASLVLNLNDTDRDLLYKKSLVTNHCGFRPDLVNESTLCLSTGFEIEKMKRRHVLTKLMANVKDPHKLANGAQDTLNRFYLLQDLKQAKALEAASALEGNLDTDMDAESDRSTSGAGDDDAMDIVSPATSSDGGFSMDVVEPEIAASEGEDDMEVV